MHSWRTQRWGEWDNQAVAYDDELAERVRGMLGDQPVTERRMFGGLTFLVNGNMSVTVSGKGGLLVRVDPQAMDELLREPGASEFDMARRAPMRGWLRVTAEAVQDDDVLQHWVDRSVSFARTLPSR